MVTSPSTVGFGRYTGLTEVANQISAGLQFLLFQLQNRADARQRKWKPKVRRPDHGTAPLLRVQIGAGREPQIPGQTHALKAGIESPLGNRRITECIS